MDEMENKMSDGCCLLCKKKLPEKPLLKLFDMPASAQDIPDAEEVKEDKGITLNLYQCMHCGLVQFDCEPVSYYRDVIRSGGFSATMVNLRRRQYRDFIETYHLEGKKFLEVGCGQGEFLSVLEEFPVKAFGIEHREALVQAAREKGLCVTRGFTEYADMVLGENGPYDAFLSFNFLEHQPNPGIMLDCIWNNLTEDGLGLVTVPSLEYILQYNGYYELLRDHIACYSFETLHELFARHGFHILEQEMINRDTCSVVVKKRKKKEETGKGRKKIKQWDISALAASREIIGQELEQLERELKKKKETLAVWGAGHQGFTLASTTCLGKFARYIIDSAPFKQGKFAPASHLPIVAPDDYFKNPVNNLLIAAPGYTSEIARIIREKFGAGVKIFAIRSNHLEVLGEDR